MNLRLFREHSPTIFSFLSGFMIGFETAKVLEHHSKSFNFLNVASASFTFMVLGFLTENENDRKKIAETALLGLSVGLVFGLGMISIFAAENKNDSLHIRSPWI